MPLHSGMGCEAVRASIMNTLVRNPITIPQNCTWRVCVLSKWFPLHLAAPLEHAHNYYRAMLCATSVTRVAVEYIFPLASCLCLYFFCFSFSTFFRYTFFYFLIICCRVSRGFQLDDCRCLFEVWQNSKAKRKRKLAHACPITQAKHGVCITNCSACIAEYQRNL